VHATLTCSPSDFEVSFLSGGPFGVQADDANWRPETVPNGAGSWRVVFEKHAAPFWAAFWPNVCLSSARHNQTAAQTEKHEQSCFFPAPSSSHCNSNKRHSKSQKRSKSGPKEQP